MVKHKRRSLLDLTPSQVQNLLVINGIAFMIFMVATRFPLDPLWAGILSLMLFGQKLVPWRQGESSSYPEDKEDNPMAKQSPRRTQQQRNDSNDVGTYSRDLPIRYSS